MRFLAAAALAVLLVLPATAAEEPVNEAIAWVMRDNIRMGWGPPTLDHYDSMRAAGMNAVMPRIELGAVVDYDSSTAAEPLYEGDGAALKALRDTSRKAKEAGLRYFHCLDIAAQHQTAAVGFQDNPARHNDGRAPSPIDPVFWRRSIIQRVDRALDLLDGDAYALDAVIVDPEMYTIHGWSPGGPDYGAYAFQRFLDETGKQAPAGLDSVQTRKEWLETSALIPAYEQWQYDCIVALARELRDLVHARRPNVILGFILYTNQMWYNAMIEGLYSPGLPVFVGPETTYSGVMDESFVAFARSVRADSPKPILFAPGVRMGLEDGRVPTEYLKVIPGNLYQRC
ncbi:MAG: hypothetical protein GY851_05070, partial [bacterium]|nr:hypothetical protein [bacterium]